MAEIGMTTKNYKMVVVTWSSKSEGQRNLLSWKRSDGEKWKPVIGLEIHAQIKSASKLFSGSSTNYGASTNSNVSFFDAALPGTLPVLNKRCVEASVVTALALGCSVNRISTFDRKHYFYADLPAGYQITQFRKPIAHNGEVVYVYQCSQTSRVERRTAHIVQIQLEQDSGKSLHDMEQGLSLIDLNRAGIGLMEIVTAPLFNSGDDAASFVRELREILVKVDTCDGKMAEGSMRVDANVSVHKPCDPLGKRTEVKNLNSFRSVRQAIDYEIERQISILENGGVIENETRSFDDANGETFLLRDKEKLKDYRFMPEPNLPPLVLDLVNSKSSSAQSVVRVAQLKSEMEELPDQIRQRLEETYGISLMNSMLIVRENLQNLFELLINKYQCPPTATVFTLLRCDFSSLISELALSEIIHLYDCGRISGSCIAQVFEELVKSPDLTVEEVIVRNNLWSVDDHQVASAIEDVLKRNPKIVKAYKKGKTNQLKILTLKVMNSLDGRAATGDVNKQLAERLKK